MAQPKRLLAFRCGRSTVEQLAELAREGDRTLSAEIRRAIREHVASQDPAAASSPPFGRPEEGERRGPTAAFRWVERDVTREDVERIARAEGDQAA